MKTLKTFLFITFISLIGNFNVNAEVKLPRIFSSNMVLQKGIDNPVWGWANKGEQITVTFNNQSVRTKTDKNGKWSVKLPVQEYGGPYTMTVKGKNTIVFDNILIGEVWVCSGQSNMEFQVGQAINAVNEIATANFPKIRLFTVPKTVSQFPENDISSGEWEECSPETVSDFSAVAYFFGRDIFRELNVPIGLIHTSWGGTVAETWSSAETISKDPDLKGNLDELKQMDLSKYKEEKMAQIKKILGGEVSDKDLGMENGKAVWAAPDFNDSNWKTIKTPIYWEQQGFTDIDGIAWYRKEIILTEEQSNANATLHLGKIDDADITFVNGVEIGKTNSYDKDRVYTIESKILKPGKNIIAVRVDDTGGNGGIWGDSKDLYFDFKNEKMDISGDWKFRISKAMVGNLSIGPNSYPTLLFNGMINPILPYGIKGAIWYQGESNAGRAKQYQRVFPDVIKDWRTHWNQGDFPFLFVSLANFYPPVETPVESDWAELREAQTKTLSLPNTGMALSIDIGEANDIHPKNKQDVGKRLALNALKIAYNKNIVFSGPMYKSVDFKDGKAFITFSETGSGLKAKDKYGYLKGFTIAGADKKFKWAKAEIIDNKTIVVYSEEIKDPKSVRYGWANNPDDLNLYNVEGLPANPFRTDDWPGITK
jgi:sialate O-acetylesterase